MKRPKLTADQLERRYRAEQRRKGIEQTIISMADWPANLVRYVNRASERNQVSRSEYLVGLMRSDFGIRAALLAKAAGV